MLAKTLRIGADTVGLSNYWADDIQGRNAMSPSGTKIVDEIKADVVIVGAGFSGMSCALHLLADEPDLEVVVIERNEAGHGASSRSAGMVEPGLLGITWTLSGAVDSETEARWGVAAARRRLKTLFDEILSRGITCEFTRCHNVISAKTALAAEVAKELGTRMTDHGIETTWIDGNEAATRYGSRGQGALFYKGYSVQPALLANSLREKVLEMGAQLYEGEAVTALSEQGGKVRATTESGGQVVANGCLVACGAWAGQLGIKSRTDPEVVHTWMCATEELPADVLAQSGAEQSALVAELSNSKDASYRRIHNGRILFGSYDEPGHDVDAEISQAMLDRLHQALLKSMPYLKGVKIDRVWGGPILGMKHDLPFIEVYPKLPNTAIVVPNGSTGVPWALLAGGMVNAIVRNRAAGDAEGERLRNLLNQTQMPWLEVGGMLGRAMWKSLRL